jgi:preprotein translocase subunit SecE
VNRQTKRMLQRQGAMTAEGTPSSDARQRQASAQRRIKKGGRTSPATFLREVRGELRRVAWPTRAEVINYSTIVLVTLAVLISLVFVLDFGVAKSILVLFAVPK